MLAQIYNQIDTAIKWVDDRIWGLPLIILILTTGIYLTVRLGGLQIRHLPKALRFMVKNEEEGHGEVTSFGALCTALSATIGTGNITGVATAIAAGGRAHCSGWWWQHFSEWQRSMQKGFLQSNTGQSIKKGMFLVDRSIILKTEWEKTGAGWQKYLHFSEPESGCLESVRLPR